MSALLDAALAYAARGWPVLALSPGSKVPLKDQSLQPHGVLSASKDAAHIRELWELYPLANVGVATGAESNLTVLDLDGPHAPDLLKRAGLRRPATHTVKTPHGEHLYINFDAAVPQGAAFLTAACACVKKCAVDTRNTGGYVVAPPSTVEGNVYTVTREGVIPWPEVVPIIAAAKKASQQGSAPLPDHPGWVAALLLSGAPEGQRNDAATRLAGYFRSLNLPQDIALAAMRQFADACTPPLHWDELKATLASVWRYLPAKAVTYQGQILPAPIVDASSERRRKFVWPKSGLEVLTDRLKVSNAGIECWLTISTAEHGDIYGPVRINLLSDSQRDALRRSLKERLEHDWQQVIQHVAKLTIASLDPSSDLIDMGTYEPRALSPWLIEPFVRRDQPTLIYGDGGEGKSTFALALALSLASGVPVVPGTVVAEPASVYMLDFESDADDSVGVTHDLARGAGLAFPHEKMFYRRLSGSFADHIDNIAPDFAAHDIKLAVVDSLVAAGGADANEAEAARIYFNAVRTLGCASIGVTHVTKAQVGSDHTKPFGSAFWWNLARVAWHVKSTQEDGQPTATLALYNRKANRGGIQRAKAFTVTFAPGAISYQAADIQADPLLARGTSVADQLWAVMGGGLWTVPELHEEIPHVAENTIRGALRRNDGKRFGKIPPEMKWGRLEIARTPEITPVETGKPW